MYIVVDKSWIQGISKVNLQKVCEQNHLILPSPLAYEIFTSDKREDMVILIKKLDTVREKVFLLENVYTLIKYELDHQKPFHSLERFFLDISFKMNLDNEWNEFNAKQKFTLNFYKNDLEVKGPNELLNICEGIDNYFPQLKSVKVSDSVVFEEITNSICNDLDLLKRIYTDVRTTNFPSAKIVNYDWAVLRQLQLLLLYGIEYKRKYDLIHHKIKEETLAHDNIDIEYLILGVLNKCIGTNDNKIKRIFNLACPGGKIFEIK